MTDTITLDRSVVEQALEALDSARGYRSLNLHKLAVQQFKDAAFALRAALEQPKLTPLTDEQINDQRLALAYDSEDLPDPWDFKQGVRTAERAHGIGGEA